MSKKKRVILGVLALLVGASLVLGGYAAGKHTPTSGGNGSSDAGSYPLLARRIFSDEPKDPLINFTLLRSELQKYFTDHNLSGSLYFEYLHTGTDVRVRGDEEQAAASLLKVPLAMELYKAAEQNKIDLHKQISLREDQLDSGFGTLYQKGAGYNLTLEEAAKIMLHDSDNTALKAIADAIDGLIAPTEGVFTYLDADVEQGADLSVSIGSRSYSSILKCLYFACYLNNNDSQLLLQYLTETPFNDRMMAGIDDPSLKVAHKIGVFQNKTQSDCGIVYLPNRPYIFCAMIDGENNAATSKYIADLSKMAYDFVRSQ